MANKVSKQKSLMFLFALRGALSRGFSLEIAIEMLSKIQPKPVNKYLSQIIFLVRKRNAKIFPLLEQYGFITKEERILFENAKDTKFAVSKVIEMRKIQNRFSTSFLKLFIFPFIVLMTVPVGLYFILGKFNSALNQIFFLLKSRGITPTFDDLGLPSCYYFVWDRKILFYISGISTVVFVLFFGVFLYLRKYKPEVLYKILYPTAFDDLPYLFSYMSALNKVGIPIKKIAEILAKSNLKPGWKRFFKDLEKRVKNGEKIYIAFEKYGFPKEIVTYIRYDEMSGDFWANIDGLKDLAMMRNKEITDMVLSQLKPVFTLIGWFIVVFFLSGLMLYSFGINNLASLLQGV